MKRRFVISVLSVLYLVFVSFVAGAQVQLPASGKTDVFLPSNLKRMGGKGGSSLLQESMATKVATDPNFCQTPAYQQKQYWVVYSDREHNKTYKTAHGFDIYGELSFNQRVTIAKIDVASRRALVYEDKKVRTWPNLPKDKDEYVIYGWVPMDNLLLWDSCPTNAQGIYNKALLSLNLDARAHVSESEAKRLFLNPDDANGVPLKLDEKIYFIMKRQGDKALLATQYTLSGADSYKVLLGWVRDISFVPWSQRSCLEPTWDARAVQYFARNNITADVEANAGNSSAMKATSWDYKTQSIPWKEKNDKAYHGSAPQPYRVPGNVLRRFPILEKKNNRYYVSSFSTVGRGKSSMSVGEGRWGMIDEDLKALQNINLVLVIDGTQSMKEYYSPVMDGLKEGCQSLSTIAHARIQIGAVIYRDAKDVQKGISYEIEKLPRLVRLSDPSWEKLLASGGEYGIRSSSNDKTLEESLFKGIEEGVKYFVGKAKESNIILVVGDCGNLYDGAYQASLCKTLAEYNVQVMGYQVRIDKNAKRNGAYLSFTDQMQDIVANTLRGIYAKQHVPEGSIKFSLKGNYYSMLDTRDRSHQGSVICPLDGSNMDADELSHYLFTTISNAQAAIQNQLDMLVSVANGNWEAYVPFLESRGYKEEELRSSTVSFQGWTNMTYNNREAGIKFNYYKPVLFLSQEELQTMIAELGTVPTDETTDRLPFVNAMKEVAARHMGLSGQDMDDMSLHEISQIVYGGLIEKSETLGKWRLQQISQPNIVKDKEFSELLHTFATKYEHLRKINEGYQGFYEFNGAKYYWIPIEDLP